MVEQRKKDQKMLHGFKDEGWGNGQKCRYLLEAKKGKEMGFPRMLPEGQALTPHCVYPSKTHCKLSNLQNCR